jgi:hypothetical protein
MVEYQIKSLITIEPKEGAKQSDQFLQPVTAQPLTLDGLRAEAEGIAKLSGKELLEKLLCARFPVRLSPSVCSTDCDEEHLLADVCFTLVAASKLLPLVAVENVDNKVLRCI